MTGLRFTETMTGFVANDAADFVAGFDRGKRTGMECTFTVTIRIPDVDGHLTNPESQAVVDGHIYCPAFGGRRHISNGRFKLFDTAVTGQPPIMRYRLPFRGADGERYELVGSKHLGEGRNPWKDTTKLKTEIRKGHETGVLESRTAPVVASGLVHITAGAFARQMTTMRAGFAIYYRFFGGFSQTLWDTYRPRRRDATLAAV